MFDIRNLSQGKLMNVKKENSNQSGKKAKKLKNEVNSYMRVIA